MIGGVLPLLLTPFGENGEIRLEDVKRLIGYYQDSMVDGLVCLGDASESQALTEDEKRDVVETTIKASKGLPIIAGLSGQTVDEVLDDIERLPINKLSGFLLPPPRNPGMADEKILDFYVSIDKRSDLPIIVLDNPGTIRPIMSPELIVEMVRKTKNVRYLKVEEQPTSLKMERINAIGERDLVILGASHGRNFLWELERGAAGILTSTPLPRILVSIWKSYSEGKTELAREIFLKSLPLAYFFSESPVAVKKEVLKHTGIIGSAKMREKSPTLSPAALRDLIRILEWTESNMDQILKSTP